MKLLRIALVSLASASSVVAQDSYSEESASTGSGWSLLLGGGADYLFGADVGGVDLDESAYLTLHAGVEINSSNSVYLEFGFADLEAEDPDLTGDADFETVTINYRGKTDIYDGFGIYFGLGLGGADIEGEKAFMIQASSGMEYTMTPNLSVYGGLRYIWTADFEDEGVSVDGFSGFGVGVGARLTF